MRVLFALVLALPLIGGVTVLSHTSASSTDTITAQTSSINSTGASLLLACWSSKETGGAGTISDSTNGGSSFGANSWTSLTSFHMSTGVQMNGAYVLAPATSGTHQAKVTGTNLYPGIAFFAIAGTLTASALDGQNGTVSSSGVNTVSTGSVTPTQTDMALTCLSMDLAPTAGPTVGYSILESKAYTVTGYAIYAALSTSVSTAQNQTWNWTLSGGDSSVTNIALFKAAAAAGFTANQGVIAVGP